MNSTSAGDMKRFRYWPEVVSFLTGLAACVNVYFHGGWFGAGSFFMLPLIGFCLATAISAVFYYRARRYKMWQDFWLKVLAVTFAEIMVAAWIIQTATRIGFYLPIMVWLSGGYTLFLTFPVHLIYGDKWGSKFMQEDANQGSEET